MKLTKEVKEKIDNWFAQRPKEEIEYIFNKYVEQEQLRIGGVSTRFLLPNDYCKKNVCHSKSGKLCFSKSSMEYFAENYCKTDWQTVDKIRLKNRMIELSNRFNNYDKNGLPIFRTSEKAQLVDLYPNGC